MKKNMKGRILAFVLAASMIFQVAGTNVYAEELENGQPEYEVTVSSGNVSEGDAVVTSGDAEEKDPVVSDGDTGEQNPDVSGDSSRETGTDVTGGNSEKESCVVSGGNVVEEAATISSGNVSDSNVKAIATTITVEIKNEETVYNGKAQKPEVWLYSNDVKLKLGKDYTVEYRNNINASRFDKEELENYIYAEGFQAEEETVQICSIKSDGSVVVFEADNAQQEEEDPYKDEPTVIIRGKGNYTGSILVHFYISPKSISNYYGVKTYFTTRNYNTNNKENKAWAPVTIMDGNKKLEEGVDYYQIARLTGVDADGIECEFDEQTQIPKGFCGSGQIMAIGIGNYKDRTSVFKIYINKIEKRNISEAVVTFGSKTKVKYAGDILPFAVYDEATGKYYKKDGTEATKNEVITVKLGDKYLTYGKDFGYIIERGVGSKKISLYGTGEYEGNKDCGKITVKAIAVNSKNTVVTGIPSKDTYDGRNKTYENIEVTVNDKKLDIWMNPYYTVTYKNNLNKGTASVIITMNSERGYTGKITKTVKILPATINEDKIQIADTAKYTPSGAVPEITTKLVQGKDYTVSYKNNKKLGTATITVKGKGNYTGTIIKEYTVVKGDFENIRIESTPVSSTKTPKNNLFTTTVKVYDGKSLLKKDRDYVLSYKDNSLGDYNNGLDAKIVVTPMGNYEGEAKETELVIYNNKLTSSNVLITFDESSLVYNETKVIPVITKVQMKTKEGYVDVPDYEIVAYGANNRAGKNSGSVTIEGRGAFGGKVTKKFTIVPKNVGNDVIPPKKPAPVTPSDPYDIPAEKLKAGQVANSKEFVEHLNRTRKAMGMSELIWDEELASIARERAKEISEDFSHNGCRGADGENIQFNGSKSYTDWYRSWYNSVGHRNNMLTSNYKKTAVAVYYSGTQCYIVQLFEYRELTKEELDELIRKLGDQGEVVDPDSLTDEERKKIEKAIEDAKKKWGIQ